MALLKFLNPATNAWEPLSVLAGIEDTSVSDLEISNNNLHLINELGKVGDGISIADLSALFDSPIKTESVTTLPTSNISESTIYLVPSENATGDNQYDEYVYINGNWEHLGGKTSNGSVDGDLSDSDIDNLPWTT